MVKVVINVVINVCFGGFGLSKEAYDFLGLEWDGYGCKYSCNDDGFRRPAGFFGQHT